MNVLGLSYVPHTQKKPSYPANQRFPHHADTVHFGNHQHSCNTDLISAAGEGDLNIVNRLLKTEGIDVNAKNSYGNTALMYAIHGGHLDIINRLLQVKGLDVTVKDNNGNTALIIAARNGHLNIVEQLLNVKGIDVNSKNSYGSTALILAADNGHLDIVNRLLKVKSIKINAKNNNGNTALMYAVSQRRRDVVKALLNVKGINVNAKNNNDSTALIWAAEKDHLDIIEQLLKTRGIKINAHDKIGHTALMHAVERSHLDVVKQLLAVDGINVNTISTADHTALTIALINGRLDIIKLLLSVDGIIAPFGLSPSEFLALLENTSPPKPLIQRLLTLPYTPLHQMRLYILQKILREMEAKADHTDLSALRPSLLEPELLFLLNHPEIGTYTGKPLLNQLSDTLTSSYGFTRKKVLSKGATGSLMTLWGNWGLLTHDFITQKYDTRGGENSLLCKLNFNGKVFRFLPKSKNPEDKNYSPFGHQFILNAGNSHILFCQGFKAISSPAGTLVIRNSSTDFGRDLLQHTTYFSPKTLSEEELLALNPDQDASFKSALDPDWYKDERYTDTTTQMRALTDVLLSFRDQTTAQRNLNQFIETANGPVWTPPKAFQDMINFLLTCNDNKHPLPSFALLNPYYPAHQPVKTLAITQERLDRLINILCGIPYQDPELHEFIQYAIHQHNLTLTLVDPPEKPPETSQN